jgi:hypothetical protein
MTRFEPYDLVWKEPMVHASERFGISDVALRKACVKHDIPASPGRSSHMQESRTTTAWFI